MSPTCTTHLGRKFDADSIYGIRTDVWSRLGVRFEETRPFVLCCMGSGTNFELGTHLFRAFWMYDVPIKTNFVNPEGSWGCTNRLGSVQGGKPEA